MFNKMQEVVCEIWENGIENHLEFDGNLRGFKDGDKLVYHEASDGSIIVKAL